ncbi:hypothetical protein [Dolosigranulum pigrum]|jgi:hypothetical protein|uniref:hypothetical protein n=1 Tax=Dolosigranulum pigrum TaxID=29394 RepID=UPI001AD86402|nr:hypothetical protein [Dolosigranulum pigrum]QTJ44128.1 hypothetical protein FE328_00435 [Dolosigranulum pigrum]
MAGKWTEYSDEQLLEMLKKTIEDMGMTKYPSRTELQKHIGDYDIPSPTSYLYRFDCSWQELMENIGYEYDLEELREKNSRKGGKKKENVKWRDEPIDKIIDAVVDEMHRTGISTIREYREDRDKGKTPSDRIFYAKGVNWNDIKNAYEIKYG